MSGNEMNAAWIQLSLWIKQVQTQFLYLIGLKSSNETLNQNGNNLMKQDLIEQ